MPESNTPESKKKNNVKILIHNQQKPTKNPDLKVPSQLLLRQAKRIPSCISNWPEFLERIEITFVSPEKSRQTHLQFFSDPTPTDVMTFPYPEDGSGEIIICPDVAEQQRCETQLSLHHELLTYIIHGILHLCGWDDLSDSEFQCMKKEQERILQKILQT